MVDDEDEPRFVRGDVAAPCNEERAPVVPRAGTGRGAVVTLGLAIVAAIFLSDASVRRDIARLFEQPTPTVSRAHLTPTATPGDRKRRLEVAYAAASTLGCQACPGGNYGRLVAIHVWDGGPLAAEGEEALTRLRAAGFPEAFELGAGVYATTNPLFQYHAGQFIDAVARAAAQRLDEEESAR